MPILIPLDQWARWPTPNYIDPPTQPRYTLIFICFVTPLTVALAIARLWIRVRIQGKFGLDDWLMLASLFPMIAMVIVCDLATTKHRMNRHVWDIEPSYFPIQRKYNMIIFVFFTLASGILKSSVLLFYRRISSRAVSRTFQWMIGITMFSVVGATVAFVILSVFMCRPVSAFWDQVDIRKMMQPGGYHFKCVNEGATVVAHGIVCTVQDLVVIMLPTILCWNLQMRRRQKIALYCVFGISYTTIAIGAIRTYETSLIYFRTNDVTWGANDIFLWTLLEVHLGSMCANTPALRVFFSQIPKSKRISNYLSSRANRVRSRTLSLCNGQYIGTNTTCDLNTKNSMATSNTTSWYLLSSSKSSQRQSSEGHLPDSYTSVTVSEQAGPIQRDIHLCPLPTQQHNTIINFRDPEYKDTIILPQHNTNGPVEDNAASPTFGKHNEITTPPPVHTAPGPTVPYSVKRFHSSHKK